MKTSQLLSSEMTLFHKKIFPIFWCGFLICIILGTGISSAQRGEVPPAHLLVLLVILVLGYFVIKTLAFDLADEVREAGDELIVTFDGHQTRIPFDQISHVSKPSFSNPRRITFTLSEPSPLGSKIAFCPASHICNGISVYSHLIHRIDEVRRALENQT